MLGGEHFRAYLDCKTSKDKNGARRAMDLFLRANLPFAKECSKRFLAKKERDELEAHEAFVYAIHGMYAAAQRFDLKRGYTFTTFAVQWISNHLMQYEWFATNHVYRSYEVAMARATRVRENGELGIGANDFDFLSLRACRYWNTFSSQIVEDAEGDESETMRHAHSLTRAFVEEEPEHGESIDGPRKLSYLKSALGKEDFSILLARFNADGMNDKQFCRANRVPLPRLMQIREAAFCHARAFTST